MALKKTNASPTHRTHATKRSTQAHSTTQADARKVFAGLRPPGPSSWALGLAANELARGWNVTDWGNGNVTAHGIGFSGDTAVPDDRTMTREQFIQKRASELDWQSGASLRELESHGYR